MWLRKPVGVIILLVLLAVPLVACGEDEDATEGNSGADVSTSVTAAPDAGTTVPTGTESVSTSPEPGATTSEEATTTTSSPATGGAALTYPTDTLQIMAPASPGGGWDTTAREIQAVLQSGIIDQNVEVFNVPGAGGTVGLAQLVNDSADDDHLLMMTGLVMVGAILTNASPVSLQDTTPIARLTTEYEVIVVPADSEFQTLDDLIQAFQRDPGSISWAGGSAGGTDHILVGLIAKATDVDPTQINYIPYSGGGEALAAILGGQVSAGVSGVGEWLPQIEAGELRVLAVSSAEPLDIIDAPTLTEQGVDVELANWRGLVAPPDISDEARQGMIAMVEAMRDSEEWQATLERYGWEDFFLAGDEFTTFLEEEQETVTEVLQGLELVE